MASALFSPITMRGLTLPNRIAVSPMCQYNSTDGTANDWHLMHIGQFALGGFGLIIAEMTNINMVGRISYKCATLATDDNEKALKRVVDFARQYGPSKHGLQIGHAGRKGSTQPPAQGAKPLTKEEKAWETVAPSAIPYGPDWHVPRAMTKDEMKATLADYLNTVKRAERIGYDLLELHAAHGYLLHQFLSPLSNQRTDEYGGSLAKAHALSAGSILGDPRGLAEGQAARHPRLGGRLGRGRHHGRGYRRLRQGTQGDRLRLHGRQQRPGRRAAENPVRRRLTTCRSANACARKPGYRPCRSG